jgi:hypothetical protein
MRRGVWFEGMEGHRRGDIEQERGPPADVRSDVHHNAPSAEERQEQPDEPRFAVAVHIVDSVPDQRTRQLGQRLRENSHGAPQQVRAIDPQGSHRSPPAPGRFER